MTVTTNCALTSLIEWFSSQCDGNWEHSYGIIIESLDNPGWMVSIDTRDLDTEIKNFDWVKLELENKGWMHYHVKGNRFECACDPNSLRLAIETFIKIWNSEKG